jgi:hypothetical protein
MRAMIGRINSPMKVCYRLRDASRSSCNFNGIGALRFASSPHRKPWIKFPVVDPNDTSLGDHAKRSFKLSDLSKEQVSRLGTFHVVMWKRLESCDKSSTVFVKDLPSFAIDTDVCEFFRRERFPCVWNPHVLSWHTQAYRVQELIRVDNEY